MSHGDVGLLGHTWSLAQEEQFYIVSPVLLLGLVSLGGRRAALWFCLLAIAAITFGRSFAFWHGAAFNRLYYAPDARADGLLIGCALALAWQMGMLPERITWAVKTITLAAGAILAFVILRAQSGVAFMLGGGYTLVGIAAAVVVNAVVVCPWPPVVRILSSLRLVLVGRRSYALYLWHVPIFLVSPVLVPLPLWLSPLWICPLAWVAAGLSERFIERRALALKSRITVGSTPTPTPAAAVAASLTAAAPSDRPRVALVGAPGPALFCPARSRTCPPHRPLRPPDDPA